MLAKVKCHRNLGRSVGYNEVKVQEGKAECLLAANFIKDSASMTFEEKEQRFAQRTSLYENSVCNAVHISLNFSNKDSLSDEKMSRMAEHYMNAIGFEKQPYLVYRHFDTNHPHLHVVSTNITAGGKRIQMNGIVRSLSREVVKGMEKEFSLTRNERSVADEQFQVTRAQQVIHGEDGIKRGISDVLNTIVPHYNYTSFEELNAALRLYNVAAHRGEEGSRLYKLGGLFYYALNEEGRRVSLPIKASSFTLKPTLSYLEKRFAVNLAERPAVRHYIDTHVDWILDRHNPSWGEFLEALGKEGISGVVQMDKTTGQESIFFVNHGKKCVFAGEGLGVEYGIGALKERCSMEEVQEQGMGQRHRLRL